MDYTECIVKQLLCISYNSMLILLVGQWEEARGCFWLLCGQALSHIPSWMVVSVYLTCFPQTKIFFFFWSSVMDPSLHVLWSLESCRPQTILYYVVQLYSGKFKSVNTTVVYKANHLNILYGERGWYIKSFLGCKMNLKAECQVELLAKHQFENALLNCK